MPDYGITPETIEAYEKLPDDAKQRVLSRLSTGARQELLKATSQTATKSSGGSGWAKRLFDVPVVGDVAEAGAKGLNWWNREVVTPLETGAWRTAVAVMPGEQSGEKNIKEMGAKKAFGTAKLPWGVKTAMDIGLDPLTYVPVGGVAKAVASRGAKVAVEAGAKEAAKEGLDLAAMKGGAPGWLTGPLRGTLVETPPEITAFKDAFKAAPIKQAVASTKVDIAAGRGERFGAANATLNTGKGKEAFNKAQSQMAGVLKQPTIEPMNIPDGIYDYVKNSHLDTGHKFELKDVLDGLEKGIVPTGTKQIKLLGEVFGDDMIAGVLAKRGFAHGAEQFAVDLLNFPRAVLASFDVSAPLRQGLFFQVGRPKEALGAYVPMFKALKSEKNMVAMGEAIENNAYASVAKQSGLYLAPLPVKATAQTAMTKSEEAFMSRFANNIPGIRASNRAYVLYLNKLRMDVFSKVVKSWEVGGKKIAQNDLSLLAKLVNIGTGRGSLGRFEKYGPEMSTLLFSPRLQMARLQLPTMLASSSSLARKEFARDGIALLGAGTSLLAAFKIAGIADIETDPRSADWGKIRLGNTRIDIWGGNQQYMRLLANIITEQKKSVGGTVYGVDRVDTLWNFLQGKASPSVGIATDLLKGQTFTGEEFNIYELGTPHSAAERLAPMFLQTCWETLQEDGPYMMLSTAVPSALGVGVASYGKGTWQEVSAMRERYNDTGLDWTEMTPDQRKSIETANPDLKDLTAKLMTDLSKYPGGSVEKALKSVEFSKDAEFTRQMDSIANAKTAGAISWSQYNDQRSNYMTQRYSLKSLTWAMQPILTGKTEEEIQKSIEKNNSPLYNSMREYKDILGTPLVDEYGLPDWESTFAKADKFLQSQDAETRTYIQAHEHDWVQNLNEQAKAIELRRIQLVDTLKPYWEIRPKIEKSYGAQYQKAVENFKANTRINGTSWRDNFLTLNPIFAQKMQQVESQISQRQEAMKRVATGQLTPVGKAVQEWYQR